MSVKKLLAMFCVALMFFELAYPNQASCMYGLFSQEKILLNTSKEMLKVRKNVLEQAIQSADKAGDMELTERLRKELQEIHKELQEVQKKIERLEESQKEEIREQNPKIKYEGLG
ncbi:MAG: hypothetical protein IJP89_09385 [Synergistaceae bacterium]|nr:hypothetical protein [Synergistaceae bacterium]